MSTAVKAAVKVSVTNKKNKTALQSLCNFTLKVKQEIQALVKIFSVSTVFSRSPVQIFLNPYSLTLLRKKALFFLQLFCGGRRSESWMDLGFSNTSTDRLVSLNS